MIKSDFGVIEITGFKPVVMAELKTLLKVLRSELGEADYNRVLQDANDSKQFGDEPETSRDCEKERMKEVLKAILKGMEDK